MRSSPVFCYNHDFFLGASSTVETAKSAEEQSRPSVDGDRHETEQPLSASVPIVGSNTTKNDEALPKIYSEQASKRDLAVTSQEAVAKDSSSEATENVQEQERTLIPSS